MSETIAEITKKYIGERTLQAFADSLGINASPQSVFQWKKGEREPNIMTLFRVIGSGSADHEAKEWARECIMALQTEAGIDFEPDFDNETERRR